MPITKMPIMEERKIPTMEERKMREKPITPEMLAYIEPMYQYQKRNNITGMRLMNSLIIHERFTDYKPKVGVVVALCPDVVKKTTTVVVIPHVWNEKDPFNKLESSIDVLQFGNDLGQYELSTFLDDCKRKPMIDLVSDEMKRRIGHRLARARTGRRSLPPSWSPQIA